MVKTLPFHFREHGSAQGTKILCAFQGSQKEEKKKSNDSVIVGKKKPFRYKPLCWVQVVPGFSFESSMAEGWLIPERDQAPSLTQFLFIY